ncbi:MAG: endonuclease MutS2 [Clostridia bacterium]
MQKNKLEIDKILLFLQDLCVTDGAKLIVSNLAPIYDNIDVKLLLDEVTQAKTMLDTQGAPSFYGVVDPENSIKRTELSGVLSCEELLQIALLLRTVRELSSYHDDVSTGSAMLDRYFSLLHGDTRLENAITNAIVSEEELADTASSELFDIRRKIRSLNSKTREYLNQMISKENNYLQENLITIRNNRFVVPVKTEHKGDVRGLIHDVSSSGNTLFIEPTEVVEANNELRILLDDEQKEIERILKMFSIDVKKIGTSLRLNFEMLTALDFIFAKAKLSVDMNAYQPILSDNGYTNLINAVHPLLERKTAVPVSLEIGAEFDTLIITGPNTGGKTVCLKTLGLLTMMASMGMHIPADFGSEIYILGKVYADIGDEQSIGESLSTFSSHMTNIISILDVCEKGDLLLFDELGSGTDPLEGSALAVAIIEHARKFSCRILATTHYSDIKLYALETSGVQNASFEFNMETLSPTYNLIIGSPGKSNAFEISNKLGLQIEIINSAKSLLSSEHNRFETILANLEHERIQAQEFKKETEKMRVIAKNALMRAEAKEKTIDEKYEAMVEKGRLQATRMLDDAKRASRAAFDEIEGLKKLAKQDVKSANINKARQEINKNLSEVELKSLQKQRRKNAVVPTADQLKVGVEIRLLKTNNIATVITPPDKQGKLVCKAGILKITANIDEVELFTQKPINSPKPKQRNVPKAPPTRQLRNEAISREVDIRGMDVVAGIDEVESFISSSILANIEEGYIIHGKGTGVLRNSIRDYLRTNRHIKSYRAGRYGEGEDGVTVITFK